MREWTGRTERTWAGRPWLGGCRLFLLPKLALEAEALPEEKWTCQTVSIPCWLQEKPHNPFLSYLSKLLKGGRRRRLPCEALLLPLPAAPSDPLQGGLTRSSDRQ